VNYFYLTSQTITLLVLLLDADRDIIASSSMSDVSIWNSKRNGVNKATFHYNISDYYSTEFLILPKEDIVFVTKSGYIIILQ
jgi:hypothetical protein